MNWRRTVHHIITLHNTLSQSKSFEHTEYPINCNFASDIEKLNNYTLFQGTCTENKEKSSHNIMFDPNGSVRNHRFI